MSNRDISLDPRLLPISRRGAWMSLGWIDDPSRGPGWYLRTNRNRPLVHRTLFRLCFASEGTMRARPGVIEDEHENRIVFDGTSSVRIESRSPVVLESAFSSSNRRENAVHAVAFAYDSRRAVVNSRSWLRKYGIEAVHGHLTLDAPWDGEMSSQADITVTPDESGKVELAVDEISSTWIARPRRPITHVLDDLENEVEAFVGEWTQTRDDRTASRAAALMWMCTQSPSGNLLREAIFMSLNWMDSVWSWDNWINMAALVRSHPALAFDQFLVVADHQDVHGAYPDALNDGFMHFNFAKPPVQGVMITMLERLAPTFFTPDRVRSIYDSLARFTSWWLETRRTPGRSLCHYLHGNDSGWDNGTLMRTGVPLEAPDLNAFLVVQCALLARWARQLEEPQETVRGWQQHAAQLAQALLDELWVDNAFVARRLPDATPVRSQSLASLIPLVAAAYLPDSVVSALLGQLAAHETDWGLATEAPQSSFYEAENYWRGPIWAPTTLIMVHALQELGETAQAERLAGKFRNLVRMSGFAENFQAETGAPLVDPGYTWTASAYLVLASLADS
jgi:putative isomerase